MIKKFLPFWIFEFFVWFHVGKLLRFRAKPTMDFFIYSIFKQTFSRMNYAKCPERSRLTDKHLHSLLRIGVTLFTPSTERFVKEKQTQISHSVFP